MNPRAPGATARAVRPAVGDATAVEGTARDGACPGGPRHDPELPQLAIVLDPIEMRRILGRRWAELSSDGGQIEDCRLDRFRYRPGRRCVVQYALRVRDPRTGRASSRWLSAVVYPGDRAERIWEKTPRRAAGGEATPGRAALIAELGMLAHAFPHDRKLPGLAPLVEGPPPEVARVLLESLGPGAWCEAQWTMEPVRYRAALGATLRCTVQARDAHTGRLAWRCFFVKVYRRGEAEGAHAALRALRSLGESGGPFVAGPVALLAELDAVVQEEVAGTPLSEVLAHGGDPVGAAARVGRALARLHGHALETVPRRSRHEEAAVVARAARLIGWARPDLGGEAEAIAAAVAVGLEGGPLGPTHRDLKLDHVFLDGGRVGLIDVDGLALTNPLLDLGVLLADLLRLSLGGGLARGPARAVAHGMLDAYFAAVPAGWRAALPVACAAATLDKALHFVLRQPPAWRETLAALVAEARGALAGHPWWRADG